MLPAMENISKKQKLLIGGGVLVIILVLVAAWFWGAKPAEAPVTGETPGETATTTDETGTVSTPVVGKPNTLPEEPAFTLPEGAVALDEYAFILNDQVFFRSLTSKEPLAIPNSDAKSFEKISDFTTLPGDEVVADCGISGTYGFYADRKQVYFYQYWRAPKFRSSAIEVIVGADKDEFKVTGRTTATSGKDLIKVSYEKATTSCAYKLSKVAFEPVN